MSDTTSSNIQKGPTRFPLRPLVSDPGQPFDPSKLEGYTPDDGHKDPLEGLEIVPKVDLYDFLVYRPTVMGMIPGPARTWVGRSNIYMEPGREALHAVIRRYIEGIHWVQTMSWRNQTDELQEFDRSYTTSLTVTEGREVENGFNIGASFKGFSFGVNSTVRTFSSRETTTSETTTVHVRVPPQSLVVFYQRRYDFRDEINFVNDAFGSEFNVGSWGAYEPLTQKTSVVQIMADEYFTTNTYLPNGPGSFEVPPSFLIPLPWASITKRRNDASARARNTIASMGI